MKIRVLGIQQCIGFLIVYYEQPLKELTPYELDVLKRRIEKGGDANMPRAKKKPTKAKNKPKAGTKKKNTAVLDRR